ncbi:MAG: HIT family protein, partial [Candidatus Bipolaricaulaceae bacterium]
MTCPFCRIAQGELSAHLLYADEEVLAFLDAAPMAPGHTLVVPRLHVERFVELPEELAGKLFVAAVNHLGYQLRCSSKRQVFCVNAALLQVCHLLFGRRLSAMPRTLSVRRDIEHIKWVNLARGVSCRSAY